LVNSVNLITLGTKVDNSVAEKFQNMCNDDGITTSEELRNLITMAIESHEDYLESERRKEESKEEPKITVTDVEEKRKVISHGKILDDYGNVIGTF